MNQINKDTIFNIVVDLKIKKRQGPDFNKILSLLIRHITEYKQNYKITPLLKEVLDDFELYDRDEIDMIKMRLLNSKLKKAGYKSVKSAIQLEHWKDVLTMRTELLSIKFSNDVLPTEDDIIKVESYFKDKTHCFFKLSEKEHNLQPPNSLYLK